MLRVAKRWRPGSGDKSPLSVAGDSRGVLCLHGITGTPFEIRPLAEALGRRGCSVLAPMLAGHGGTLADLAATGWTDWLRSAEAALDSLQARVGGRPVAICGFSMGGLLALRLARLFPERISALVVMSTPLRLRRFQVAGIRALARLPIDFRAHPAACVPKFAGSDVSDEELRYENPGLRAFPIAALEALLDLMDTVRADLPAIQAPVLVVHGRQDHTVPMEDSLELTGCLGSAVIERLWLDKSFHIVTLDVERDIVIDAATRFLSQHAGWPASAS
ncbi:MAG TPA: alpha/beta fold hydrolase [Polyangia bacterium]|jgi:carboxylesterase|nr:alpha/beta fold hydrolase [Polyangia bacterium]